MTGVVTLPPGGGHPLRSVRQQFERPRKVIAHLRPWLDQVRNNKLRPFPDERAAEFRDRALERHRAMPAMNVLIAAEDILEAAVCGGMRERETVVIISLMLDMLPTAKNFESTTYIEGFVALLQLDAEERYHFKGFSPEVLLAAAFDCVAELKYPPTFPEFKERAEKRQAEFRAELESVGTLIFVSRCDEELLIETGDLAELPDDGFEW
jgi:hypothetical protein